MSLVQDVQYDVYHHGAHLLLMLRDASRPNSEVLRLSLADLEARHKALAEAAAAAAAAADATAAADAAADAAAGAAAGQVADGPTGAANKGKAKAADVVGDDEAERGVAAASGPTALAPIVTPAAPATAAPAVPLPRLTVLLPHSPEVKLESLLVCSGYAVVLKRQGGLQRASVHALPPASKGGVGALEEGGLAHGGKEVSFEEPAYSLGAGVWVRAGCRSRVGALAEGGLANDGKDASFQEPAYSLDAGVGVRAGFRSGVGALAEGGLAHGAARR